MGLVCHLSSMMRDENSTGSESEALKFCDACGKCSALIQCPCRKAVYCNRVCQRHHWKAHREHCNARRGPSLANKGSHVRAGPVSNHSPAGFSPHKQQTTNKSPPVSRQVLVGLHERDSQRPMHTINTQYHPMRLSSKPKKISEQHMASSEHEISNRGTSVIIKSMQNVPIPLFRPKLLYPTLYISRFDSFVKKIHSSSLDLGKVSAPGENIKDTQTLTKTLSSEKLKPSPNDPEMYPFICRECDRVFDTCNARDACLHTECPEQMHQKQFAFVADAYQHCVREHKAESSSRTDEVVRPAMMSRNTSNSNRENEGIEVNVIYNAEDTLNKWASTMAGCNEDTRVRSDDEMQDASQRALDARAAADPGAGTRMYVESSGGVTVANAGLARLSDTPNASSNSGGKREIPMDVEGTQVDDTTSSAQSKPKSCSDGKTVHPPSREISDQSGPLRSDTYHDGLSQTYSSGDDLTRANAANDFESTSAIAIATPAVAVDLMEPVGGNNENAQNTAGDGQTIQKAPAQTAKTPRAQNIAYRVEKNISATDREITTVCYTAAHDILRASVGNHKSYEAYQEGGMTDTITEGMADTTTTEACGVGGKGIESEHSREATSAHSLAKAATTLPHGTDELPHGSIIVEQPTTTPCDPTPYKVSDTAAGWTDGDNGTMREAKDAEEVVINMCTSEPDTAIVEKVQVFSKDDELPSTNLSTLAAAAVISGFKENFGDVSDVRDSVSEPNHSKSSQVHATLESNTQDNPPTISLVSLVPSAPCTINPVIAEDSSTIDGTLKAHSPLVTDANVISDDDAVPIALSAVDRASCPDAPERDAQYATNTSGGVESTTSNVGVSPVSIGASAIENPSMDTNNIDLAPDLTAPISHINVSLVMETSLDVGCTTCGNDNPPIGVALSNSPHDDSVSQSIMDAPDDSCRAPHDSVFQSVVGAPDDSCRGGHDSVSHSVVGAPDNSCRGGHDSVSHSVVGAPDNSCREAHDSVSHSVVGSPDNSCRGAYDSVSQSVVGAPDDSCRAPHDSVSQSVMGAPNDSCRGARDSVSQPVMNASDDSGRDDSSIAVPPVGDPSLDTSTEAIDFFASSILDAPLDEHIEDCESGSPPKTKIDATHGGDAQYFTQSPPITPGSSVEASTLQPGNAFDRSPIAAGVRRLFVGSSSDELESLKHMSSVYMTPPDTISTRQAGKRSTANDGHVRVRYKSSSFEISADEQEFATSAPPIPLATELVDTKRKFVVSAMKGGHVLEAVYTLPEECEHLGELYASKGAWALNPDGTVQPRSRTLMSGAAVDGETVAAWVHTDGVKLKQSSTLSVSTTTVDGQSIGSQNTTEYLHGADVDKSDSIPDMLSDSIPDTCPDSISDTCTDESIPDTCTESLEEYEKAIKGGCLSPGMIPTFVDSVLPHPGNVSAASRMGAIGSDPQISTMTRGGVQASVGVRQPDSEDKGKGRSKESPALTEDRTVDGDEGMPLDTTLTHSTHLNAEEDAHIYVDQHDGNIGLVHNRASEVRGNAHSQNKQPTSKDEIEHGTLHKDIHVTQKSTDQFGSEEGGGEGKDDVLRDTASAADIPLPNVGVSKLAEIASRLLQKNTKSARSTVSRAANSSRTQSDSYDEDRSFPVAISTVDPQASIDVKTARELPITADASLQNTRGVSMETEYVGGRARGVKRSAVVPQSISRSEDTESCYMVYRGCDRTFDTIQKRDQYLQTGTGQRPYECAVLKCRQGFAQATEVNAHYGTEHAQLIKRLKLARQAEAKARAQNITAREHADWERVKQHAQEAQRRARRHGDDRDAASGTAKTVKRGKTPQRARPAKVKQKKSTEKHTSKLPNRVVRNKMAFHRALKAVATSGNNGKRTAVGRPKTKTAAAATATAHKTKTATGAGTTKPSSQADKTSSVTKVSKVGDAHKRQPIRVAYPIHPPSPERHYTCPELNCGKRYARKHYYTQHMKKAHQINA